MMTNQDIMIGLYQGMIPKNTLTFNPEDVRSSQRELKAQNVPLTIEADESTDGPTFLLIQDPDGNPILTLADTLWFGPAVTWPQKLSNYPYIEFWHRFDIALEAQGIPGMGPELLGDDAWQALFSSGPLVENMSITMSVWEESGPAVLLQEVDQLGAQRPLNALGDIGAIEIP